MTDFLLGGYAMTNTTSLLEDDACTQACGATFALHAFAKAPFQGQFVEKSKTLKTHGQPLFPSPYLPPRFAVGNFEF